MMYMISALLRARRPCFYLGGLFLAMSTLGAYADARIWYVDVDSTAISPDGSSWEAAFTDIQEAINAAVESGASETNPAEVWVAEGVYTRKKTIPRAVRAKFGKCVFVMQAHVYLYGGFFGNETERAQREWERCKTVIDAGGEGRCVAGADNSTLDGFTLTHGNVEAIGENGGGMHNDGVSPSVANCTFTENRARKGGAVFAQNSSCVLTNCVFKDNKAGDGGGVCYRENASPQLDNCMFMNNTADNDGGAVCAFETTTVRLDHCIFMGNSARYGGAFKSDASASLKDCDFQGNTAKDTGGGVCCSKTSESMLLDCSFKRNTARLGGGLYTDGESAVMEGCLFTENRVEGGEGGGAYCVNSLKSTLTTCVFKGNTAVYGGGLYNEGPLGVVTKCQFIGNAVEGAGGGIYCDNDDYMSHKNAFVMGLVDCEFKQNAAENGAGMSCKEGTSLTLQGCNFVENAARNNGGGLSRDSAALLEITNCTFSENTAGKHGGGIGSLPGWTLKQSVPNTNNCVFMENEAGDDGGGMILGKATGCTFRGNIAKRNGGGLCNGFAMNCVFIDNTAHKNGGGMCWSGAVNSTFFGNIAQGNGGGVYDRHSVFLTNCIVWGNSAEKEGQAIHPVHAEAPRVTYSCIEGGYTGEGNIDTPPLFVNPDEGDVSLQADSPCIDTGTSKDAPTTDIQGASRPQGNGVDMGAYEWITDKTK